MKLYPLMLLFALLLAAFSPAHAQNSKPNCDSLVEKKTPGYGTITVLTNGGATCWFVIKLVPAAEPYGAPFKEKLVVGCVPAEFTFELGVPVLATATDQWGQVAGSAPITLTQEGERKTLLCSFK